MDASTAAAWLHRRAGWGLHPSELEVASVRAPADELARLVDVAAPPPDPWSGLALDPRDAGRRAAIGAWLRHLVRSEQPFADRRTWMLHGWLVSSLAKVTDPRLMVDQIRLLMRVGGDSYRDLLRAITTDRAMLVYLDGRTSTAAAPNENFARELLELFALGVGHFSEQDVRSAARALTGWVAGARFDDAVLVPRRHDDTPQVLLGVDGVHDVDTVVDAILAHPEHARFVAVRIASEYLGDPRTEKLDGVVDELATTYLADDRRLDAVVRRALELGLEGAATPLVAAPVPWLVTALRTCGVDPDELGRDAVDRVRGLGQVPMLPPDVSGWPIGEAWFTAGSLVARTHLAVAIAAATRPDEPIRVALDDGDLDLAARRLGLTEPFTSTTAGALRRATDPDDRLTLALVCPENLLA
jgi:uncharacterized protein (DUF1800 family)